MNRIRTESGAQIVVKQHSGYKVALRIPLPETAAERFGSYPEMEHRRAQQ